MLRKSSQYILRYYSSSDKFSSISHRTFESPATTPITETNCHFQIFIEQVNLDSCGKLRLHPQS
jgi:hypothetical protein